MSHSTSDTTFRFISASAFAFSSVLEISFQSALTLIYFSAIRLKFNFGLLLNLFHISNSPFITMSKLKRCLVHNLSWGLFRDLVEL